MEVVLLGTGSADGWPNAFCTCSSCATERRAGRSRSQSSALVDDVLLLDCGPTTPANATRLGRTLSNVRHLLLTHAHIDHTAPAALLWRSWARRPEPLTVHGPRAAIDACRNWIGPHDNVSVQVVTAGDEVVLDGYVVRALAANHGDATTGDCLIWDVQGSDDRLLYATDTGPLPEETLSALATYDLVLLEETFGDLAEHDSDHHDLTTFPRTIAALRELGAVTSQTRVVAIHLGHHNPPTPELTRRVADWGAEVHPDGAVITSGYTTAPTQAPHRTLVIGGARSGKSVYAEGLLAAHSQVTYVATAGSRVDDEEWTDRVALHQSRRPSTWRTIETLDVASVLRAATPGDAILVDCLTLWLTAVIDGADAWENPAKADTVLRQATEDLIASWRITKALVVAVTNEVGQGVVPATVSGRLFRDALGRLNATVAAASEDVMLLVAGRPVPLPRMPLQGVSP